ncbi:copper homeostasis CutC domain-containing protein [Panaeolus papilionaceus]|nr:copper homeostasis CutC domain-containing protein [Panaeolus papilionaceus]
MPALPQPQPLLIEVCVDSVESAIAAVKGGADRLEICGNLGIGGGTTPSFGLVTAIQKAVDVQLMIMVRPRVGDFVYSKDELEVIVNDIKLFKQLDGLRGFVVGALTPDGRVDVESMKKIVDEILPLEVSFHRAFDLTRNAKEALRDIADIGGIARVLTSGQKNKALDGLPTLESLFKQRKELVDDEMWGLTIMPGSGVNASTIPVLLKHLLPLGLKEIHLSGGEWISSSTKYKRNGLGMGASSDAEWQIWRTKEAAVKEARRVADELWDDFKDSTS